MAPDHCDKEAFCRRALLILALIWLLPCVWTHGLASGDETRVAGIAAETVLFHTWTVPRLNGMPFLEYPPCYYWWTGLFFRIFGIHVWAAQLAAVTAAGGTVVLAWKLVRKAGGTPKLALTAAFLLMSSAQFWGDSHKTRVDILLVFFVNLTWYGFLHLADFRVKKRGDMLRGFAYMALGAAGGIMTKGLLGAVLPASGIGIWLIADDLLSHRWNWRRYLLTAAAFFTAMIPYGLWLLVLYRDAGFHAVHTVVVVNNFGRFGGTQGDHASPFYDYLLKFPEMFQPYWAFLVAGLVLEAYTLRKSRDCRSLFLLCLTVVPFFLLSLASAKRMVYMLPLAPIAAIQAADFLSFVLKKTQAARLAGKLSFRQWIAIAAATGVIVQIAAAGYWKHRAESDLVEKFWMETIRIAKVENRTVVLISPPERTRGAAVFYLQKRAETRPVQGRRELWVNRCRQGNVENRHDWHRAFRMPEEKGAWNALHRQK